MKRVKGVKRAVRGMWALSLFLMVGCATVAETGRRQVLLISADQELKMGLSAFEQTKQEVPISKNAAANEMLQRVGQRIAAVATDLPNAQWEFVLFESEQANAFCLPGGKVGVYTGILPITRDEVGLATVIGHEVAHAVARHGGERVSHGMLTQAGAEVLTSSTAHLDPKWQPLIQGAYGIGTQVGYTLPYSRLQESEADQIGLRYMARAGYNPQGAVAFWERFAEYGKEMGDNTPTIFRTHPMSDTRIRQIKEWMPEAMKDYRP